MKHRGTEGSDSGDLRLTDTIIGSAIEVHRTVGPGLLESAYRRCLFHEISTRGLQVETEIPIPLTYKGIELDCGYRLDLLVEKRVIVELKAIEKVPPIAYAQLLSYLRLTGCRVGSLINFHTASLRIGVRRIVNG